MVRGLLLGLGAACGCGGDGLGAAWGVAVQVHCSIFRSCLVSLCSPPLLLPYVSIRPFTSTAGDSRAVLVQHKGRAVPLSDDHKVRWTPPPLPSCLPVAAVVCSSPSPAMTGSSACGNPFYLVSLPSPTAPMSPSAFVVQGAPSTSTACGVWAASWPYPGTTDACLHMGGGRAPVPCAASLCPAPQWPRLAVLMLAVCCDVLVDMFFF
jgi:hypothetical protein